MKELKNNKLGQGTLEYLLLFTAIATVIIFLLVGDGGPFRNTVQNSITGSMNSLNGYSVSHRTYLNK